MYSQFIVTPVQATSVKTRRLTGRGRRDRVVSPSPASFRPFEPCRCVQQHWRQDGRIDEISGISAELNGEAERGDARDLASREISREDLRDFASTEIGTENERRRKV